MPTYALIDQNSGYLWGVIDADTPIDAVRQTDESLGCHDRHYIEKRIRGTTQTGYQVLDVTGIMSADEVLNGTDQATIERACTGRRVAEIACYDKTDD